MVILGSPVWAGTFAPPLRTFLDSNDLSGKKIAILATSSGGNADKCINNLKAAAKADSLAASVSLIDPHDHPSEENDAKIKGFIDSIL